MALTHSKGARHAFRASAWSASGYGLTTALRFVSRLVLAKMLNISTPMGDVAIVMVILAGLEMISDLGIGVNIVQHRSGDDPKFLGTAFSLQALRGSALWAIASLLAFPIAGIYHAPQLAGLILFGALGTLFKAFTNPGIWVLTRQVDLRGPTLLRGCRFRYDGRLVDHLAIRLGNRRRLSGDGADQRDRITFAQRACEVCLGPSGRAHDRAIWRLDDTVVGNLFPQQPGREPHAPRLNSGR
jgi:hypothetical protein